MKLSEALSYLDAALNDIGDVHRELLKNDRNGDISMDAENAIRATRHLREEIDMRMYAQGDKEVRRS